MGLPHASKRHERRHSTAIAWARKRGIVGDEKPTRTKRRGNQYFDTRRISIFFAYCAMPFFL